MVALAIIVFIVVLGLLIFVHELGHFLTAKLAGIKVQEFAFGFPPRIVSKLYKGTRYGLNAVPIGGYVKMLGEDETLGDPKAFSSKPVLVRLTVVVAGVLMNYFLAIVVFAIGFAIGMTPFFTPPSSLRGVKDPKVFIGQVFPDSPAQKAGFSLGDQLIAFDSAVDLQRFTQSRSGQTVEFDIVAADGQRKNLTAILAQSSETPLGVALFETATVKLPAHRAVFAGAREATNAAEFTFKFFGSALIKLFTQGQVEEALGGPVAIFGAAAQAAAQGLAAVLQLIGILSVNLAIINIVPFPALDGGRALFIAAEGIFGRKVLRDRYEGMIHMIGFIILIALILAITYRDIIRLR